MNELPDNHRRSLSVTAKHIEQGIEEIELLLLNHRPDSSMLKIVRNLNDKDRSLILSLIKNLKTENDKMFNELNLTPEKFYEDRIVRGNIGHIWVLLSDSTSKGLKGYGSLPPGQAQLLDNYITTLLNIVYNIQSIIK